MNELDFEGGAFTVENRTDIVTVPKELTFY